MNEETHCRASSSAVAIDLLQIKNCSPEEKLIIQVKEQQSFSLHGAEEQKDNKRNYTMVASALEECCKYVNGDVWDSIGCAADWSSIYLAMKVFPHDILAKYDESIDHLQKRSLMLLGPAFEQWSISRTLNDEKLQSLFNVTTVTPQNQIETFIKLNKVSSTSPCLVQQTIPKMITRMRQTRHRRYSESNIDIASTPTIIRRKTRSAGCELSTPKWRSLQPSIKGVRLLQKQTCQAVQDDESSEDDSEEAFIARHIPLELKERRIYYQEFQKKKRRSKKAEDIKLVEDTLTWSLNVTDESYVSQPYDGRLQLRGNYDQLWIAAEQYKKDHPEEFVHTEEPVADEEDDENVNTDEEMGLSSEMTDEETETPRARKRRVVRHTDDQEPQPRVKTCPRTHKNEGIMRFKDAALLILSETNRSMSAKEIAEIALDRGLIRTNGKTPDCTIAATIYSDIAKFPDVSPFKYVTAGIFGLRSNPDEERIPIPNGKKKGNGARVDKNFKRSREHQPPVKSARKYKKRKNGVV